MFKDVDINMYIDIDIDGYALFISFNWGACDHARLPQVPWLRVGREATCCRTSDIVIDIDFEIVVC